MEKLAYILKPFKDEIALAAVVFTVVQFFSGALVCYDFIKKKTTKGVSIIPFLGGVVLTVISLQFGFMLADDAMIKVNLIGFALYVIYVLVYYFYTPNQLKNTVWLQIGVSGGLIAAAIGYAKFEDPNIVEFRFGMLLTVALIALIGSPLLSLPTIIRNKSTEGLPFPIILSGSLVGLLWLLHGICINNETVVLQNLLACGLTVVQLSLFLIYPSTSTTKGNKAAKGQQSKQKGNKKVDKTEKKNNNINEKVMKNKTDKAVKEDKVTKVMKNNDKITKKNNDKKKK